MKSERSVSLLGLSFSSRDHQLRGWAYHRLCLSFRGVGNLLAEREIIVSYETIRRGCPKFGLDYARKRKRREGRLGGHWHLDEAFIRINGQQQYLWRAVDQDGDVIDILVQAHRDQRAAERFFRRLLRGQGVEPLRITTDRLMRERNRRPSPNTVSENFMVDPLGTLISSRVRRESRSGLRCVASGANAAGILPLESAANSSETGGDNK
jgi:transposase-like protein